MSVGISQKGSRKQINLKDKSRRQKFGNEIFSPTPPNNVDPEIVKKLSLLMVGSEKSYTLEKATDSTVMGFGQDEGEILSTYSSESDANSDAMYYIGHDTIERSENVLPNYVPPEGQKYPLGVDAIKLFKSHENVASWTGGEPLAGPSYYNVENITSLFVEK